MPFFKQDFVKLHFLLLFIKKKNLFWNFFLNTFIFFLKDGLISKIEKLKSQHEEACYLRDVNDKRGDNVAVFLEKYCSEEEFADFQYYVDMKSQLALMQSEIREKVKLGEERLKALEQTGSDWGIG